MNPGLLQSVRVTAAHHALIGQVVRVVRRKRHRGEAYLVVEVLDGSRQLIAARSTEAADDRPSTSLRFTPGSLRALVKVIGSLRNEACREICGAPLPAPAAVGQLSLGGASATGNDLGGTTATSASQCDRVARTGDEP